MGKIKLKAIKIDKNKSAEIYRLNIANSFYIRRKQHKETMSINIQRIKFDDDTTNNNFDNKKFDKIDYYSDSDLKRSSFFIKRGTKA